MPGAVLVGTSSWTDKSLVESGHFYPPGCTTPEQRLRFYAQRFPVVQNDAAWYALPARAAVEAWVERTPPGFVFDVKLFRLFTAHATPLKSLPVDLRAAFPAGAASRSGNVSFQDTPEEVRAELLTRYVHALQPLKDAGKLGIVLIQLAPWAGATKRYADHLRTLRERLPDWPLAVEFRHQGWFLGATRERTLGLLTDLRMAHVVADEPQGSTHSIPLVPAVTWPAVSILRLHGRNAETWEKKGLASSSERFNYEYSRAELAGLVPVVRQLAELSAQVHVMFNVNFEDQGTRATAHMQELLGQQRRDPPAPQGELFAGR